MTLSDIKEFLKVNDAKLRSSFNHYPQEEVRILINKLYSNLLTQYENETEIQDEIYLCYFELLNYYSQAFKSSKTLDILIEEYKKPRISYDLVNRQKVRMVLVTSRTDLFRFQILKEETSVSEKNNKEFIYYLLAAKKKLSKLYSDFLANEVELNIGQQIYCLENLGICYADLSRWFESLYYINLGLVLDPCNINLLYTKALVFDRLRDATCQNYSGQLLFQILKTLEEPLKYTGYPQSQLDLLKKFEKEVKDELVKYKLNFSDLSKEFNNVEKEKVEVLDYLKFIGRNDLFLSEHSDYCKCKAGMKDNLQIKSTHNHTKISYVESFEVVLESVKYDFIEARHKFYQSLDNIKIKDTHLRLLNPSFDYYARIKETFLKESFKLCLSIFDTIAIAILEALKIDYVEIQKTKKYKNRNIYFTNIFDKYIDFERHKRNIYLNTIYSICEDLKEHNSGHRDLKDIRNSIEHGIFLFQNDTNQKILFNQTNFKTVSKQVMEEKTKILLVLTKSLIISFTYLVRIESKFEV
jgi:hypothetical protein